MTATDLAMPVLGGWRVLVVEADEDTAASLTAMLRLKGFDAHAARTIESARTALIQNRPHVVVIDPDLPNADGCEIVRRARCGPNPIAVVVLSGHSGLGSRRAAAAAGANEYLLKPTDPADLANLIYRYCDAVTAG